MSEEKFYRCIPELNKECKKSNCFINGGECENTIHKEYALKGLLEEIERLKKREQECIDHYLVQCKYASEMEDKYITANNIINELAFIFDDYNEFNEILEKYNYELKGSE